jgi:hypothetical protein
VLTVLLASVASLLLHIATPAQDKPSKADKPAPNAAVLYRKAMKELLKTLPLEGSTDSVDLPEGAYDDAPEYTGAAWREAVRKSAVALSLFGQATQIETCKFDGKTEEITTELMECVLQIMPLKQLFEAQGWQQLKSDPRTAAVTAMQLLRFANHCAGDDSLMGPAFGFTAEQSAAKLLRAALKQLAEQEDHQVDAKRFLKQFERHIAGRPTRASLADTAEREFELIFNGLKGVKENPAIKAAGKRAREIHGEMLAPLRHSKPVSVKALKAHYKHHFDRLRKLTKAKDVSTVLENGSGETLAAVLLMLAAHDMTGVLEPFLAAKVALVPCLVELTELAGK